MPSEKIPKNKLATHAEYSKLEFRGTRKSENAMKALGAGWHDRGVAARFAYAGHVHVEKTDDRVSRQRRS